MARPAYATSAEPVAIAYNRRLLPEGDVPKSHADLLGLLRAKADAYKGKVATVDPERSGSGFLLLGEDLGAWPEAWSLVEALGQAGVVLHTSGSTVLDGIAAGRYLIGHDVLASAARARARRDPDVAWVLPSDFTVVLSRVAFVARAARSPNAARLFLDFLLSREGQQVMAGEADLYAVRKDVAGELTLAGVAEAVGEGLWPVPLDERLLRDLDVVRRLRSSTAGARPCAPERQVRRHSRAQDRERETVTRAVLVLSPPAIVSHGGDGMFYHDKRLQFGCASSARTRCSPARCSRRSAASRARSGSACSTCSRPGARAGRRSIATCCSRPGPRRSATSRCCRPRWR